MTDKCDTVEIMKQLKVLDSLRELRENMGTEFFSTEFPELNGMETKLDTIIAKQEDELQTKINSCGELNVDEIPAEIPMTESNYELEPDSELEPEISEE